MYRAILHAGGSKMTQIQRRPSWPDPWRCTVEVLVVSGCPGTELAIARIREATEALRMETNLRFVIVEDEEQARAHGFIGSPTVRVEGVDVEDGVAGRPPGLACRIYSSEGLVERAPPLAWIHAALARSAPIVQARSAVL
jgi:hypothetical protein